MDEIENVRLTLYKAKIGSDETNAEIESTFNAVQERLQGEITYKRSSVVSGPKIRLEYDKIEKAWRPIGEAEEARTQEIDFGIHDTADDIIHTIQAKTGINPKPVTSSKEQTEPVNNFEQEPEPAPSKSSTLQEEDEDDDVQETIEKLKERAGVIDTPEPDFE